MADKKKPLYQPWSEEEFRGDIFVQAMTPVQRWMYRALLQASFFYSTRPYLPDNDSLLWMLAGCENPQQWNENKDVVRARFTPIENTKGEKLLSQKRVCADWKRLVDKRKELSAFGRKGGKAAAAAKLDQLLEGAQAAYEAKHKPSSSEA